MRHRHKREKVSVTDQWHNDRQYQRPDIRSLAVHSVFFLMISQSSHAIFRNAVPVHSEEIQQRDVSQTTNSATSLMFRLLFHGPEHAAKHTMSVTRANMSCQLISLVFAACPMPCLACCGAHFTFSSRYLKFAAGSVTSHYYLTTPSSIHRSLHPQVSAANNTQFKNIAPVWRGRRSAQEPQQEPYQAIIQWMTILVKPTTRTVHLQPITATSSTAISPAGWRRISWKPRSRGCFY